jgi:site-specific DNA-methyltransferase (adenine-specific)
MMKELTCCDARDWLWFPHKESYRMMFADPPDGIGMKYNGFKDKISPEEYERLLYTILTRGSQTFDFMWLSLNTRWTALIGHVIHEWMKMQDEWEFKPCLQFFTFGQHNHRDFGNNHRLLYRFQHKDAERYMNAVRVPSWRQLNGDKRADPRGRVPGDVFEYPRVTGNSKQRRSFSPTQLHEGLYERCILSCCQPGDWVVDLFAGSGTLGRVADRCKVNALMVEKSKQTCKDILKDQKDVVKVKL